MSNIITLLVLFIFAIIILLFFGILLFLICSKESRIKVENDKYEQNPPLSLAEYINIKGRNK